MSYLQNSPGEKCWNARLDAHIQHIGHATKVGKAGERGIEMRVARTR